MKIPDPTPLAAYGTSILASSALDLRPAPQCSSGVDAHDGGTAGRTLNRFIDPAAAPTLRSLSTSRGVLVLVCSGVATGWTAVDMSTPLLLEVTREIDTNPTSFYKGIGVGGSLRLQTPL